MALVSGPGDDIDAWCGKCTMVLTHRIIAVVSGRVKKSRMSHLSCCSRIQGFSC